MSREQQPLIGDPKLDDFEKQFKNNRGETQIFETQFGQCAIIVKDDYTDWNCNLKSFPSAEEDMLSIKNCMLDFGFSEDNIKEVPPTFDEVSD